VICELRAVVRPRCTLSPYTPLFRSDEAVRPGAQPGQLSFGELARRCDTLLPRLGQRDVAGQMSPDLPVSHAAYGRQPGVEVFARSEEHTSELQSRENLVCRLLLEKK